MYCGILNADKHSPASSARSTKWRVRPFISAVYIYDLDNIEIVWKFKDFLTTSEGDRKSVV